MKASRSAFTMIELIFVMVIIGIVAAVGIPKLMLTRNDARGSVIATKLGNCIVLAGKGYLQNGILDINDTNCVDVTQTKDCFTVTADDNMGTLKIKDNGNSPECKNAQMIAKRNHTSSATGVIHHF
jgi:prepilin-type N-terminal cleavage/methylation domain-containing protein